MRSLSAVTGVSNIFGFTLSALPTSILDAATAVADDPAMRKSAMDFATATADQIGLPEKVRGVVGALLSRDEQKPQALQPQVKELPVELRQLKLSDNLIAGGSPSKTLVDAVGAHIINQSSTADTFADRLRAYIPIEVLSVFITVNGVIGDDVRRLNPTSFLAIPTLHGWVSLALLLLSAIAIVAYTRRTGLKANTVWGLQACISILAFLVWTYAVHASFYKVAGLGFDAAVSALCLGAFTLASGFVVPITTRN